MSYYLFNRKELLQEAKDRYHHGGGKEKAVEYYLKNRGVKRNKNNKYKILSEEEKEAKIEYQRYRYRSVKQKNKPKEHQATKILFFLYSLKMSGNTLKFDNIEIN